MVFVPIFLARNISEWLNNVPNVVADAAYREVWDLKGCFDGTDETWCPDHQITYAESITTSEDTVWCLTISHWDYFDREVRSYIIVSQKQEELNVGLQKISEIDDCLK